MTRQIDSARPSHILIADDDAELRAMLGQALRRDGHHVTEVPDGWELNRFMTHHDADATPIDLVLTDVRMPGPSIFATLGQPWACTSEAPSFVVMSAFGDESVHRRARELGAAMFDKPFDIDDLRTCIGQMVGTAKRWRPKRASTAPKRVLVADDDDALRELLVRELKSMGCVVVEADSGFQLLSLLADAELDLQRYDLLVTDIRMAGVTGVSVLRGLRLSDTPHLAGLPAIVMTSFGDEETRVEVRRLGATLLDKPFEGRELRMWARLLLDVS